MELTGLLSLVEEGSLPKLAAGVERAVRLSFHDDAQRDSIIITGRVKSITQAEVKRRVQMCIETVRVLRGDLKWGIDRIVDRLPSALRTQLDGKHWNPEGEPKRALWTPDSAG